MRLLITAESIFAWYPNGKFMYWLFKFLCFKPLELHVAHYSEKKKKMIDRIKLKIPIGFLQKKELLIS